MNTIERMFMNDVREKKRIGSNIFSRTSTRKGGTRQALRTPYLYMSNKERNQLNGEVMVYNMNEILDYGEFKDKSVEDQRRLMLFWRENYKTQDIQDNMGISRNTFYKIIDSLDIPKEKTNFKQGDRLHLDDDEIERFTKEFIDFKQYRQLRLDQQFLLLDAYIKEYGGIRAVRRAWEGSDEGYMYSVRSRYTKKMEREELRRESLQSNNEKGDDSTELENESTINPPTVTTSENDKQVKDAISLLRSLGYHVEENGKRDNANISINTDSFTFNLNGNYDTKTIKRRLELVLGVLEDNDESLNINISISN